MDLSQEEFALLHYFLSTPQGKNNGVSTERLLGHFDVSAETLIKQLSSLADLGYINKARSGYVITISGMTYIDRYNSARKRLTKDRVIWSFGVPTAIAIIVSIVTNWLLN